MARAVVLNWNRLLCLHVSWNSFMVMWFKRRCKKENRCNWHVNFTMTIMTWRKGHFTPPNSLSIFSHLIIILIQWYLAVLPLCHLPPPWLHGSSLDNLSPGSFTSCAWLIHPLAHSLPASFASWLVHPTDDSPYMLDDILSQARGHISQAQGVNEPGGKTAKDWKSHNSIQMCCNY